MLKSKSKRQVIVLLSICISVVLLSFLFYFYTKRPCSSISSCLVLAKKGNPQAQDKLGKLYLKKQNEITNPGNFYNLQQAFHWFRRAASLHYPDAQYRVGMFYVSSVLNKDYCLYFFRNISSILSDLPDFKVETFKEKLKKSGISITDPRICDNQNFRQSFINIMNIYASGYFMAAAEQGNSDAQNALGTMYLYGQGVKQDYSKAASLFYQAATAGNSLGAINLSSMYANGQYYDKSYSEAYKWAKVAADKNNIRALNFIGGLFYAGLGVPKDFEQAFAYFKKAAKRGDSVAQITVGSMLSLGLHGDKSQQNLVEAYAWLNIGISQEENVSQSSQWMVEERNKLYASFNSDKKEKANALSALYWEKYVKPFQ